MNKDIEKTITEIRSPLDSSRLSKFLTEGKYSNKVTLGLDIPKWKGPFTIKQFVFGQSNPTYLIIDGNGKFAVLRRKPSPNDKLVAKLAHAIEREFFLLNGINHLNEKSPRKVPIPQPYLLCEDESVIGYVFYVMEFIDGAQIKSPEMPGLEQAQKDRLWNAIMETISAIHSLDVEELLHYLPETHFPRSNSSSSYFERQVRTLKGVSDRQSKVVDEIPSFDKICQYILKHGPSDPEKKTLIHGDCKIDNLLFDKSFTKVVAVLDWELSTFGHPLFDLANFLTPFQLPSELIQLMSGSSKSKIGKDHPESLAMITSSLKLYYDKLGHPWDKNDPSNNPIDTWNVGFVFGLTRLSVISQGIAMRIQKGSASSANAAGFAMMYPYLANLVMEEINESKL